MDRKIVADILDKQIVNPDGKKIRRVNDVELSPVDGEYRVIGIGVGYRSLFKRLGLEGIVKNLRINTTAEYIAWKDIDINRSNELFLKLKIPYSDLKTLYPADIAQIVEQMNTRDSINILNNLDEDLAADILEEIASDKQVCLFDEMNIEKSAAILNKMSPDAATDLFNCISKEKSDELLRSMDPEEASDIRSLLKYPPDTAGES